MALPGKGGLTDSLGSSSSPMFLLEQGWNIVQEMSENIAFQVDILLGDIAVAVGLGNEFAAFAINKESCFPVHSFDRAQAPAIVLIGSCRDSVPRHRCQPLIIGEIVDCCVYTPIRSLNVLHALQG